MTQRPHDISVIICAYTEKRWQDLEEAVQSVCRQTLPPREIIIVIDHNPVLYEMAKERFADLLVIENTRAQGSSGARNCGAERATSELLAFIDDDAIAEEDWLEFLSNEYDDPFVMGSGGRIIPRWDAGGRPRWFPEEFDWVVGCTYRGAPQARAPVRNLILCNMSMRREIFNDIGGFRTDIGHCGGAPKGDEETELCIRAQQRWRGYKFIYQPEAVVHHRVPEFRTNLKYFFWRCSLEGNSKSMLSGLVGSNDGLASEWDYTLRALPAGVARGVWDVFRHFDVAGLGRAAVIVAGLFTTTYFYLKGRLFFARSAAAE